MKGKLFYLSLLFGIVNLFSSCYGQNNVQQTTGPKFTIEIGKVVDKLDSTIWSIYQDRSSNFWFGSKTNGVFFYNGQYLKQITKADGLVSNEIRGIQEDSKGNIFFETESGVTKFDGLSLKTLEVKNALSPTNNWILKPDDLWFRVGFNNNGAYRSDGQYLYFLEFPKSPQEDAYNKNNSNSSLKPYGLYTIYKDRKGFIWFGTAGVGLCRFDGNTISWIYEEQLQTTPEGGDFGSRAIFEDKDGLVWINNTRFRYDLLPNRTNQLEYEKEKGIGYLNRNNQIEYPFFLSITQDNQGDLWMVTYDDGVWRYNGKELINYPIKDGEKEVLLFTIHKDRKGILWLGTFNAGVYKFNGKSFEKF